MRYVLFLVVRNLKRLLVVVPRSLGSARKRMTTSGMKDSSAFALYDVIVV